jgi:hypothetical protein
MISKNYFFTASESAAAAENARGAAGGRIAILRGQGPKVARAGGRLRWLMAAAGASTMTL